MRHWKRQTNRNGLLITALAMLLVLLPSVVSAQQVPPHVFLGSATVNGSPAPDGTSVAAFVDGEQVASVVVTDGSYPAMLVGATGGGSFAGKRVTFAIGGIPAAESAFWVQGELTELNLTGAPVSGTQATPTPTPIIIKGDKGDPGPTGLQGVQGPAGPAGSGGPAGPSGPAGPAGVAGPAGAMGPIGPVGRQGDGANQALIILALVFGVLGFLGAFCGMVWRWLVE